MLTLITVILLLTTSLKYVCHPLILFIIMFDYILLTIFSINLITRRPVVANGLDVAAREDMAVASVLGKPTLFTHITSAYFM